MGESGRFWGENGNNSYLDPAFGLKMEKPLRDPIFELVFEALRINHSIIDNLSVNFPNEIGLLRRKPRIRADKKSDLAGFIRKILLSASKIREKWEPKADKNWKVVVFMFWSSKVVTARLLFQATFLGGRPPL